MNPVTEKIDERILRLLGLEDVFDLDYDTYLTLLKEEIVKGADKLPQEELAILANERKRVRGKKGRFKPEKEKITADKIATTKFLKLAKVTTKPLDLYSPLARPNLPQQDLIGIQKPLESIANTLSLLLNFRKKASEEERREKETQRRTKKEEGLEGFKKGISAVSGAAKKMLAPFQSIIDRIWRFIFFTLLGRAFTQLMDWLGDPENKKKIESLGRFLKDWWPSLAFAAGLFLTPFGGFIRGTIKLLRGFIPGMLKIIPKLAAVAAANPIKTAAIAAGIGAYAISQKNESNRSELKKTEPSIVTPKETKETGKTPRAPQLQQEQVLQRGFGGAFKSGGIVPRFTMGGMNTKLFDTGYEGIDGSTGQRVSGFGPDTQQIIAQPGEIVMNKKTVDAVGADNFLALNRQYGGPGANKPKMGRLQTASGGGVVIQKFQNGGMVRMRYSSGTPQFGEMPLVRAALNAGITGKELAALLAQTSHETGGFKWDRELGRGKGMGYSGGDAYHGRGYIQLTHDYNYKEFGDKVGVDLLSNPDLLLSKPDLAAKATIDYWKTRVRPNVTDWNDTFQVSRAINNPSATKPNQINHYEDRVKRQQYYTPIINTLVNKYSPKPKTDPKVNRQKLIDKRPWYDKFGWFGGASRVIQKKQGGGEVEALERTYKQGQKSGMSSEVLEAIGSEAFLLKHFGPVGATDYRGNIIPKKQGGGWHVKENTGMDIRGATDYRGNIIPKKQGGGLHVKENTGMDIRGATADRQRVDLQPGEYVLPVDFVNYFGVSNIDRAVARFDSNSNSAKLGYRSKNVPNITPLPGGTINSIKTMSSGGSLSGAGVGGSPAGSNAPMFSEIPSSGVAMRSKYLEMYGVG